MVVRTVTGEVAGEDIGPTLTHEHLSIDVRGEFGQDHYLADPAVLAGELELLRPYGLATIVDAGTDRHRRDPLTLQRIAQLTDMHIIAATGYLREDFYPPNILQADPRALAAKLIGDITDGIAGSGIPAGVVKMGSSTEELSDAARTAFAAAALAQQETGVGIITHTEQGVGAVAQLTYLESLGVDPARIQIGHLDCTDDLSVHHVVASHGAHIGFDRIGNVHHREDSARVLLLAALLDRGWASRITLSHDISRASRLVSNGGAGFAHLFTHFLPAAGIDDSATGELQLMLVDNPRRLLAGPE